MSRKRSAIMTRMGVVLVVSIASAVALGGCTKGTTSEPAPAAAPAPAPAPVASLAVGARVAAPWGGDMYIGSVTAVRGDKADVLYDDDQQTREIAVSDLKPVEVKTWNVGDEVMAVWSSGRFYSGTITEAKAGDVYTVKWDDGSEPSDVEAAKIIAP